MDSLCTRVQRMGCEIFFFPFVFVAGNLAEVDADWNDKFYNDTCQS